MNDPVEAKRLAVRISGLFAWLLFLLLPQLFGGLGGKYLPVILIGIPLGICIFRTVLYLSMRPNDRPEYVLFGSHGYHTDLVWWIVDRFASLAHPFWQLGIISVMFIYACIRVFTH